MLLIEYQVFTGTKIPGKKDGMNESSALFRVPFSSEPSPRKNEKKRNVDSSCAPLKPTPCCSRALFTGLDKAQGVKMLGFAPASAIESTEKATSKVTRDQPASKLPLEPELRGLYSQAAEAFADGRFSEAASGFERVLQLLAEQQKLESASSRPQRGDAPWIKRLGYLSAWSLGQVYERIGEPAAAFEAYAKATHYQPKTVLLWLKAAATAEAAGYRGACCFALRQTRALLRQSEKALPAWNILFRQLHRRLVTCLAHASSAAWRRKRLHETLESEAAGTRRRQSQGEKATESSQSSVLSIIPMDDDGALVFDVVDQVDQLVHKRLAMDTAEPLLTANVFIRDERETAASFSAKGAHGHVTDARRSPLSSVGAAALPSSGVGDDAASFEQVAGRVATVMRTTTESSSFVQEGVSERVDSGMLRVGACVPAEAQQSAPGFTSKKAIVTKLPNKLRASGASESPREGSEAAERQPVEHKHSKRTACESTRGTTSDPVTSLTASTRGRAASATAAVTVNEAMQQQQQQQRGICSTCQGGGVESDPQVVAVATVPPARSSRSGETCSEPNRAGVSTAESESPARRTRRSLRYETEASLRSSSVPRSMNIAGISAGEIPGGAGANGAAPASRLLPSNDQDAASATATPEAAAVLEQLRCQLHDALRDYDATEQQNPASSSQAAQVIESVQETPTARVANETIIDAVRSVGAPFQFHESLLPLTTLVNRILGEALDRMMTIPVRMRTTLARKLCRLYHLWISWHPNGTGSFVLGTPASSAIPQEERAHWWLVWMWRSLALLEVAFWAGDWSLVDDVLTRTRACFDGYMREGLLPSSTTRMLLLIRYMYLHALNLLRQKHWNAAMDALKRALALWEDVQRLQRDHTTVSEAHFVDSAGKRCTSGRLQRVSVSPQEPPTSQQSACAEREALQASSGYNECAIAASMEAEYQTEPSKANESTAAGVSVSQISVPRHAAGQFVADEVHPKDTADDTAHALQNDAATERFGRASGKYPARTETAIQGSVSLGCRNTVAPVTGTTATHALVFEDTSPLCEDMSETESDAPVERLLRAWRLRRRASASTALLELPEASGNASQLASAEACRAHERCRSVSASTAAENGPEASSACQVLCSWMAGLHPDQLLEHAALPEETSLHLGKIDLLRCLQYAAFEQLWKSLGVSEDTFQTEMLDSEAMLMRLLSFLDLPIETVQVRLRQLLSRYAGGAAVVAAQELQRVTLRVTSATASASAAPTARSPDSSPRLEAQAQRSREPSLSRWRKLAALAQSLRRELDALGKATLVVPAQLRHKLYQMLGVSLPRILDLLWDVAPSESIIEQNLHDQLLVEWAAVFGLFVVGRERFIRTHAFSDSDEAVRCSAGAFLHQLLHGLALRLQRGTALSMERRASERMRQACSLLYQLYAGMLWERLSAEQGARWFLGCSLCSPEWDPSWFSRLDWERIQCLHVLYGLDCSAIGLKSGPPVAASCSAWTLARALRPEQMVLPPEALCPALTLGQSELDDVLASRSRPRIRTLWQWTGKLIQAASGIEQRYLLPCYRDLLLYHFRLQMEYLDLEYKRVAEPERRARLLPTELLDALQTLIELLLPFFIGSAALKQDAPQQERCVGRKRLQGLLSPEADNPALRISPYFRATRHESPGAAKSSTETASETAAAPTPATEMGTAASAPAAATQRKATGSGNASEAGVAAVEAVDPEAVSRDTSASAIDAPSSEAATATVGIVADHPGKGTIERTEQQLACNSEVSNLEDRRALCPRLDDSELTLALATCMRHAAQFSLETAELIGNANRFRLHRYVEWLLTAHRFAVGVQTIASGGNKHAPDAVIIMTSHSGTAGHASAPEAAASVSCRHATGAKRTPNAHAVHTAAHWEALYCAYLLLPIHIPAAAWDTLAPDTKRAVESARASMPNLLCTLREQAHGKDDTPDAEDAPAAESEVALLLDYWQWLREVGEAAPPVSYASSVERIAERLARYEHALPRLSQQLHGQAQLQYSPWLEYRLAVLANALYQALGWIPSSKSAHPGTTTTRSTRSNGSNDELGSVLTQLAELPSYRSAYLYALGVFCGYQDAARAITALEPLFRVDASSASRHGYFWLMWNHRYLVAPEQLPHAPLLYDNHCFAYWQFRCFALYVRLLECTLRYDTMLALERTLSRRMQRHNALDAECLTLIVERNLFAFANGFAGVACPAAAAQELIQPVTATQLVRPVDLQLVWELYTDAVLVNDLLQDAGSMLDSPDVAWTGSAALVDACPWPLTGHNLPQVGESCGEAVLDLAERLLIIAAEAEGATNEHALQVLQRRCRHWFGRSV